MNGNHSIFKILLVVVVLVNLTVGIASAATVTQSITYQGKLTNAAGSPLTGAYAVKFSLYDVASGGTALVQNTQTISCVNGLFTSPVMFVPEKFDGRALWLGATVGTDPEMTPRQEIRPVPYALSLRPGALITGTGTFPVLSIVKTVTGTGTALNLVTAADNSDGVFVSTTGQDSAGFSTVTTGSSAIGVNSTTYGIGGSAILGRAQGNTGTGVKAFATGQQGKGIEAVTNGEQSTGVQIVTYGDRSRGLLADITGDNSTGYYLLTEGDSSNGIIVDTRGGKSPGIDVKTSGISSNGINISTAGTGSTAISAETDNNYCYGFRAETSGYGSHGIYVQTSGDNSGGLVARTTAPNSGGVIAFTTARNSKGVDATTNGMASDGIRSWTTGLNSNGVFTKTDNDYSPGVNVTTGGDASDGVIVHTDGSSSDGIRIYTDGYSSNGVTAYTTDTSSEAVYGHTTGPGSIALHGHATGSTSQGVFAYSSQYHAIYADTGSSSSTIYGLYTPDYIYAKGTKLPAADVAEYFPVNADVVPGTVMVIGAEGVLQPSTAAYDTRVAGIISTDPAVSLGAKDTGNPGEAPLAVAGRVPCRVDAGFGAIHPGDILTTSPTPGHAMKAVPVNIGGMEIYKPSTVLGKAMGTLESGTGTIEVLVTLQ